MKRLVKIKSLRPLFALLREIAKTSDGNPFLNGSPFDKGNLGQEVVPPGGGPRDTSNFTDSRNGLTYDVQYTQVAWSLTKTYGPGSAQLAFAGYTLGPALSGDGSYFSSDNLSSNIRGLDLGEYGAMHFKDFKEFVKDLCPEEECKK